MNFVICIPCKFRHIKGRLSFLAENIDVRGTPCAGSRIIEAPDTIEEIPHLSFICEDELIGSIGLLGGCFRLYHGGEGAVSMIPSRLFSSKETGGRSMLFPSH